MAKALPVSLSLAVTAVWLPHLADSVAKGCVLIAAVLLVALSMRRASAATRHFLLVGGLAALIALPVLSFAAPQWHVLPAWLDVSELIPDDAAQQSHQMDPDSHAAYAVLTIAASIAPLRNIDLANLDARDAQAHGWQAVRTTILQHTVNVWLLVAMGLLARIAFSQLALMRLARHSTRCDDDRLLSRLTAASQRLGLAGKVTLLLSSSRTMPMTWGIARPQILLPQAAETWDETRLQAVLLHELAHVSRRDCATQLVAQVACAIHWFNPLVWLTAWRTHIERERACDDLVLAQGVKASDYAEHLLAIAACGRGPALSNFGAIAMAKPSQLEGRLMAILGDRFNRRSLTWFAALTTSSILLVAVLPLAVMRADPGQTTDNDSDKSEAVVAEEVATDSSITNPDFRKSTKGVESALTDFDRILVNKHEFTPAINAAADSSATVQIELLQDGKLKLGKDEVSLEKLEEKLKRIEQQSGKPVHIAIETNADTDFEKLRQLLSDLSKSASVTSIRIGAKSGDEIRNEAKRTGEVQYLDLQPKTDTKHNANDVLEAAVTIVSNQKGQIEQAKTELELELQTLLTRFGPNHPHVVAAQHRLATIEKQLVRMEFDANKIERKKVLAAAISQRIAEVEAELAKLLASHGRDHPRVKVAQETRDLLNNALNEILVKYTKANSGSGKTPESAVQREAASAEIAGYHHKQEDKSAEELSKTKIALAQARVELAKARRQPLVLLRELQDLVKLRQAEFKRLKQLANRLDWRGARTGDFQLIKAKVEEATNQLRADAQQLKDWEQRLEENFDENSLNKLFNTTLNAIDARADGLVNKTQPAHVWKKFEADALKQLKAAKRPVVIAVTADWCPNCQALKESILFAEQFQANAKQLGATLMMLDMSESIGEFPWPGADKSIPQIGIFGGGDQPVIFTDNFNNEQLLEALREAAGAG